jgi:hypothetical protein
MADNFATPAATPPPSLPNTPIVRTGDGQILNAPRMSPAEAAEAYAAKIAEHQARNAPPAPEAAGPEGSPAFARARLQQINSDPRLRDQLLRGNPRMVREWHELNGQLVDAGENIPGGALISSGDNLNALDRESAFDGLRLNGDLPIESEAYIRALDDGKTTYRPTQGDGLLAREARERYFKNPENQKKYLAGDPTAKRIMSSLNRVSAFAADDGRPASDEMRAFLARDGLR